MRNVVLGAAIAAVVLTTGHASAEDAKLKAGLMQARSTLVTLVKDPTKRDANQQAMVKIVGRRFHEDARRRDLTIGEGSRLQGPVRDMGRLQADARDRSCSGCPCR